MANGLKTLASQLVLSASMLFILRHTSLLSDDTDFVITRHGTAVAEDNIFLLFSSIGC